MFSPTGHQCYGYWYWLWLVRSMWHTYFSGRGCNVLLRSFTHKQIHRYLSHTVALSLQAYGAGNLHQVGVITQRAILILLLACFPCCALLINTESILLVVGQSPEVARWALYKTGIIKQGLETKMQAGTDDNSPCNASNGFMEHICLLNWN